MKKKGSLELSVNAIVILIIALAILGLVIGFAVTRFRGLSEGFVATQDTPMASSSTPITLPGGGNSLTLEKGKRGSMEISVYNSGTQSVDADVLTLACAPALAANTKFEAPPITISAGKIKSIPLSITVDGAEPVGKKSCELTIGDENELVNNATVSRSLFIEVR